MACTDGGYSQTQLDQIEKRKTQRAAKKAAAEKAKQKRLDDLTRMLCTLANATEDSGFGMVGDFDLSVEESTEIRKWLKTHNETDEKRRKKEAAVAKKKAEAKERSKTQLQLKKSALDKLTPKERKALGL
tara:strand:- start:352 stop:741 length:390 start_codon:yes stop_codon:yes gene_type:complete